MSLHRALSRRLAVRCAICAIESGEPLICRGCAADFLALTPRCTRCAISLPHGTDVCGACLHDPPSFDATLTLADYTAPIDGLILALKFGHRLQLAPLLGALLAERARALATLRPVLVPVPLAFERLAERGFNQSFEIARAIARTLDVPFDAGALTRVRHAPAQASLPLDARRRNIRGAFAVRRNVRGLRVAVVDDVMTTGSTLEEIARVLKQAGADHVTNLVVARTP
ncbi:MAG TPA: ComF family protein [Burkholderiaceae bacterium]|nr:ComF family protein [Burkholderiaceae bacterium]